MSRLFERIENFNKTLNIFNKCCNAYNKNKNDEVAQMALIQSFEICCELAWKVLKDYLKTKGIITTTPKDTIKKAFKSEIISNGQIWIDMINDRNISSHEYNSDIITLIFDKILSEYFGELNNFSLWLGGLNG